MLGADGSRPRPEIGERVSETSAQRSVRRRRSGKHRTQECYIAGVRRFLKRDPPPSSSMRDEYDTCAREQNRLRAACKSDARRP
jgi:hypothetical protein